jgi:hypothetical protein
VRRKNEKKKEFQLKKQKKGQNLERKREETWNSEGSVAAASLMMTIGKWNN